MFLAIWWYWWKDVAQELDVSWKQRNDVREESQYGFIQMLCWFSQPQGCIIQWINLIGWMNLHHATDPWPSILVLHVYQSVM